MKRILIYLLVLTGCIMNLTAFASGTWKIHPAHDARLFQIIDAPNYVYFLGYAQEYNKRIADCKKPYFFLLYKDKSTGEFVSPTRMDELSESVIAVAGYNSRRHYLVLVYDNYNIDVIHSDGRVTNIPGYMLSSIPGDKTVNNISFDYDRNRAYMATNFGYVELEPEKGAIKTSRNYQQAVQSVLTLSDQLLLMVDGKMYASDLDASNYSFEDFKEVGNVNSMQAIYPLNSETALALSGSSNGSILYRVSWEDSKLAYKSTNRKVFMNQIVATDAGYLMGSVETILRPGWNGNLNEIKRDEGDYSKLVGSIDLKTFYFDDGRNGVYTRRLENGVWGAPTTPELPDATNVFRAEELEWHPDFGMLAVNHGYSMQFTSENTSDAHAALCAYRNGSWQKLGWAYTNPRNAKRIQNPNGMAVDPNDNKYVYFGSLLDGIVRLNMKNPDDVLQMGNEAHPFANTPEFGKIVNSSDKWPNQCSFSAPKFDASGRMWSIFNDLDNAKKIHLCYWEKSDLESMKNGSSVRKPRRLDVDCGSPTNMMIVEPLKLGSNKNLLLVANNTYGTDLLVYDHNGTPDDTSDDRKVTLRTLYNQDGGEVSMTRINHLFEDPTSGLVWVSTPNGVFYFNPQQAFSDPNHVTEPKVNRNDGSGFADYLLHGVSVLKVCNDQAGRKWFATNGAGLVCTSSDGRNILEEYTSENSWLPSDEVLSVAYNSDDGSIMVATMSGLASLYPAGGVAVDGEMPEVRAYPNPVRPDYYGWITIDGLSNDALVKILDAAGNLVCELPAAQSGQTQWDCTNFNKKKVSTGVYYVAASSGPGDQSFAKVAKILVVK